MLVLRESYLAAFSPCVLVVCEHVTTAHVNDSISGDKHQKDVCSTYGSFGGYVRSRSVLIAYRPAYIMQLIGYVLCDVLLEETRVCLVGLR